MSPRQFHSASFLQHLFNQSPSETKPHKLDLVNGLGTQLLGKDDRDIHQVISSYKPQVNDWIVPNPLANQVIEKIKALIPWAEQVRFGHSREDLYPILIGLAIAYTGRSKWVVCGHGVKKAWDQGLGWGETNELVHHVAYNDLASLEQLFEAYPEEIGAIIVEPIGDTLPMDHFLSQLRALADYYGALLIFDETMTAFRFEPTAYDGIHPDLSLLGQTLANGYPLAGIVGQEEFFREVEPHHFALPGNGGELLLAIADVTLTNIKTKQVATHFRKLGDYLQSELTKVITKSKLDQKITLVGHPSWLFLNFAPTLKATPTAIVEFLCQQMAQESILMVNNHNFCASHTIADVDVLITAYGKVLPKLKQFY